MRDDVIFYLPNINKIRQNRKQRYNISKLLNPIQTNHWPNFSFCLKCLFRKFRLIKLIISVSNMQYQGLRCSFSYQTLPSFQLSTLNTTGCQNVNFSSSQMNPHKDQAIYYIDHQPPSRSTQHALTQKVLYTNNNYPPFVFSPNSPNIMKLKKGNRQMSKTATKLMNNSLDIYTDGIINNNKNSNLQSKVQRQNFYITAPETIANLSHTSNFQGNNLKAKQLSDYMCASSKSCSRENTNFGRSSSCCKQSLNSTKINNPLQLFSKNKFAKENEVNYCLKESSVYRDNHYLLEQMKLQKQTIQSFQNEIMRLNKEIRVIKNKEQHQKKEFEGIQIDLSKSKYERQLQKDHQDQKKILLDKIQELEESSQNTIKEFTQFKEQAMKQYSKQNQTISILNNQISQLQKIIKKSKIQESKDQQIIEQYSNSNSSMNRLIEGQSKKLEDQEVSAKADREEINVLLMKLQAYQNKYQQQIQIYAQLQKIKTSEIEQREMIILNWKQQQSQFVQERLKWQQKQHMLLSQNNQIVHLSQQLKIEVTKLNQQKGNMELLFSQERIKKETQNKAFTTILRKKDELCIKLSDQFEEKRKQLQNLRVFTEQNKQEKEEIVQQLFKRQQQLKYKQQQINLILKNLNQKDMRLLAFQKQIQNLRVYAYQTEEKYSTLSNNYQSICQYNNRDNGRLKQLEAVLCNQRQQHDNLLKICQALKIDNNNLQIHQNQIYDQQKRQKLVSLQMENKLKALTVQYFSLKKKSNESTAKIQVMCQDVQTKCNLQKQLINEKQINMQKEQRIWVLQNNYNTYKTKTEQTINQLNNKIQALMIDLNNNSRKYEQQIRQRQKQNKIINQLRQNHEKEMTNIHHKYSQQHQGIITRYTEEIHSLMQIINNNQNKYKLEIATFISQLQIVQKQKEFLHAKITQIQQNKQLELPIEKQRKIQRQPSNHLKVQTERQQKSNYFSDGPSSNRLRNNTDSNRQKNDSLGQDYVEVDRQGLIYMGVLLGIQIKDGSILNTLISALQNFVQENRKHKTLSSYYLQLLELFGIDEGTNHHQLIMTQISNFRENIQFLIEKLKEQEQKNQKLFEENSKFQNQLQLRQIKEIKLAQELQSHNELIIQLTETIIRQNIRISNSRQQVQQVMLLTKQPFQKSQHFLTVNSFGSIDEEQKKSPRS